MERSNSKLALLVGSSIAVAGLLLAGCTAHCYQPRKPSIIINNTIIQYNGNNFPAHAYIGPSDMQRYIPTEATKITKNCRSD